MTQQDKSLLWEHFTVKESDESTNEKRPHVASARSFVGIMQELYTETEPVVGPSNHDFRSNAEAEVDRYLKEVVNFNSDPLEFYKCKSTFYPHIAQLARKYLAAPPTSVASERMFSTSGGICSDRRTCLRPEKLESLVYLNKNLNAVDYDY